MNAWAFQELYRKIQCSPTVGPEAWEAVGSVLDYLKGKKVLIYPAGVLGRLLSKTLCSYGVTVDAFIDRAAGEIVAVGEIPVKEPSIISSVNDDCVILIAANSPSLFDTLNGIISEKNSLVKVIDGFTVNRILRYPTCQNQLKGEQPFDIVQCENCGYEGKGCVFFHTYLQRVAPGTRPDDPWRSKRFDWFGCIISQRCTMKCRYCCESIPILPNPGFVPADIIISDIQKIVKSCNFLKFVEFIGGEPFLHPEIENILSEAIQIENIGYIKLFTNGTINPSNSLCKLLKNPRIMLHVSNYEKCLKGKLLENFLAAKRKLDNWSIHYVYIPQNEWKNFSSYEIFQESAHSLEERFTHCPIAPCHRLYRGVLYRCPHQYAGIMLGKLERKPIECIDIHNLGQIDLAKEIEEFETVPFTDACRHCRMPFDAEVVPPGEQL